MNDLDMFVGLRLHWVRQARRVSVEALANASMIEGKEIEAFEAGRHIPARQLSRLAAALSVPRTAFFAERPADYLVPPPWTESLNALLAVYARTGDTRLQACFVGLAHLVNAPLSIKR